MIFYEDVAVVAAVVATVGRDEIDFDFCILYYFSF